MKRRPVFYFFAILLGLITMAVMFVHSTRFAKIVKTTVARYIPSDVGIQGDFRGVGIHLFPPGVSIEKPKVTLKEKNLLNLPEGSKIEAERIEFKFFPLKLLIGNFRVHEVAIVDGRVDLSINPDLLAASAKKAEKTKWRVHWDELFQIQAEALVFQNTEVTIHWLKPDVRARFQAEQLRLAQWSGDRGQGYQLNLGIREITGDFPKEWKIPEEIKRIDGEIYITNQGIEIAQFKVQASRLSASLGGEVVGDILQPVHLKLNSSLNLSGDLEEVARILQLKAEFGGEIAFDGKIEADLSRFKETLSAEGLLKSQSLRLKQWEFDQLALEGKWSPASGDSKYPEVSVTRGMVGSVEKPRVGGHQPGRGGAVKILPCKFRIGSQEKFSVPLELSRAHIHWLAAPALVDVYPLDLRVNGKIDLEVDLRKTKESSVPWKIDALLDLRVIDFHLDNQRYGKNKPLTETFFIKEISLIGGVTVDATGIVPKELKVSIGESSKFIATGKIDFKTGYDLKADGQVDLKDFGKLAGNEIRGVGRLKTHVRGPSSHVYIDFDSELKDAFYINLFLGSLNGKITWDDGPSDLLFQNVKLVQGATSYSADGKIALGDHESIRLDCKIFRGEIADLSAIFSNLTKDIWWFPTTLTGPVQGTVQVSGGLATKLLKVVGNLDGQDWDFYGERLNRLNLVGGFDGGRYFIDRGEIDKYRSHLSGKISYSDSDGIDWRFQSRDLTINDFDFFSRLDVPIRGKIAIESSGKGKIGSVTSGSVMTLSDFVIRGATLPPSELNVSTQDGMMTLKGFANGGQGTVDAVYGLNEGKKSYIKMDFKKLDFAPLLIVLNPSLLRDSALTGLISGNVDLNFLSGKIEYGSGKLALNQYVLAKQNTRLELTQSVNVDVRGGAFDTGKVFIKGSRGQAAIELSNDRNRLNGLLSGNLDLGILEFLSSTIERAGGTAVLEGRVGGSIKEPTVNGRAYLKNGEVKVRSFESSFQNLEGQLQLKQNQLLVKDLKSDLANGSVTISGNIDLYPNKYPTMNLMALLVNNKLKVYPFQYVRVNGKLTLKGEERPYLAEGVLSVESALSREKVFQGDTGKSRKALKFEPPVVSNRQSNNSLVKLNIRAEAKGDVLVKNELFDAELKGDVRIVNTLEAPRILGSGELIQGKMFFKEHVFQIQSGNIVFDNPTVIDPKFDLSARTDVNSVKIDLYASGRLSNTKIEFNSNPVLQQSEILSLLTLGFTPEDKRLLNSSEGTAMQRGEAASLLLHSLDFNRGVKEKTGLELQLDESVDTQRGQSIFRRQSEGESSGASPKIVVKRKIGKRLDMSFGSTVGVGNNVQHEVNAEMKMTPGMSFIGVWNTFEGTNTQETQTSYGVDLKLQKRFK